MYAGRDDEREATVSFRIAQCAGRATLPELPRLVYPEAHDALEAAIISACDPADVRLSVKVASDFLYWLKAAAYRHTKDQTAHAPAVVEAAQELELALDRLAEH